MSNTSENFHSYKIPSPKIRYYRRAFYGLHRKFEESIDKWLKRIESRINRCDYTKFSEYLIIDRFFSELNNEEIAGIQSERQTWSLKQLHQYLWTENVNIEREKVADDKNGSIEIHTSNDVRDETDPLMENQAIETVVVPLKKELVSFYFVIRFDSI